MDFFAMVGGHGAAIYRMDLKQELQAELSTVFDGHADCLTGDDLEAVPFKRENFRPDETEVLEISPFDLPDFIYEPLQNAVGWPTLSHDDEILSRVYCVFSYDPDGDRLVFQVIPRQQRLTRSSMQIIFQGDVFTKQESPGLVLGSACHAVYEGGALRFRSMHWVKQIIDISPYYGAATEADVERFAEIPSVHVENLPALKGNSGPWYRTRIAYILDSGILNSYSAAQLSAKAAEFEVPLSTVGEGENQKLVIPEDRKTLRSVLKFLEEEYFSGPITGAAYEANSKRRRGG